MVASESRVQFRKHAYGDHILTAGFAQDAKDTLVRDEYESNARKKRRLDKDKADYEIIKPGEPFADLPPTFILLMLMP